MIISNLTGGLGNQMYQYAIGRHLALRHKTHLKLHFTNSLFNTPRTYALDIFKIKATQATSFDIHKVGALSNRILNQLYFLMNQRIPFRLLPHIYIEKQFSFDSDVFNVPNNTYIQGFWNNEKYFKAIEITLRKDFTFRKPLDKKNAAMVKKIQSSSSVSLHVRRGDYVTNPLNKALNILNRNYYLQGVNKVTSKIKKPTLFIFSDDIVWCKQNLTFPYQTTYVNFNTGSNSYWDMYLMSQCKHNIIANSSFSWWASWLNQNPHKIVIKPL